MSTYDKVSFNCLYHRPDLIAQLPERGDWTIEDLAKQDPEDLITLAAVMDHNLKLLDRRIAVLEAQERQANRRRGGSVRGEPL